MITVQTCIHWVQQMVYMYAHKTYRQSDPLTDHPGRAPLATSKYKCQKVYTCIWHDVHIIYMYVLCTHFLVLTTLYCQVINLYVCSCQALSSHVSSCQSQIQCLCTSLDMDVYTIHSRPVHRYCFYWFFPRNVFIIWCTQYNMVYTMILHDMCLCTRFYYLYQIA